MMMWMVLGVESENEGFDHPDGEIEEGWLTYVEARNARSAAELAMDEIYEGAFNKLSGLTIVIHPMSGKAREHRFVWKRPVEAQLIAYE
jgi:hypothetical protein